jgi:hypothetical protein
MGWAICPVVFTPNVHQRHEAPPHLTNGVAELATSWPTRPIRV